MSTAAITYSEVHDDFLIECTRKIFHRSLVIPPRRVEAVFNSNLRTELAIVNTIESIRSRRSTLQFGKWPRTRAFDEAIVFVKLLKETELDPIVSIADDGEVNFLWDSGTLHIDLGFYGDGTYSFYARNSDGKESFGDDVPYSELHPDIAETLGIDS